MTKYIEIKGHSLQSVATDPEVYAGAWASGGNMNTARRYLGGCGIQTAALGIAGYVGGGTPGYRALVEQYDGTSWPEIADLNTARNDLGGTPASANNTSALAFGGTEDPPVTGATEEWARATTTKTVGAS